MFPLVVDIWYLPRNISVGYSICCPDVSEIARLNSSRFEAKLLFLFVHHFQSVFSFRWTAGFCCFKVFSRKSSSVAYIIGISCLLEQSHEYQRQPKQLYTGLLLCISNKLRGPRSTRRMYRASWGPGAWAAFKEIWGRFARQFLSTARQDSRSWVSVDRTRAEKKNGIRVIPASVWQETRICVTRKTLA